MKKNTGSEAIQYAIVGGACTLIDFGILYLLTYLGGVNYLISSTVSFMSGTMLNYLLCTHWVFKIRLIKKQQHEFLLYVIITAVGLGINTMLIWTFTEYLSLYYMVSKAIASFATYFWNFGARKYYLHNERK